MSYKKPIIHSAPRTVPYRHELNRHHDDGEQQREREQEPVLLEISQGNERDQHRGNDVAQGNRCGYQTRVQYHDEMPTTRFSSELAEQNQDQHDNQNSAESPAAVVAGAVEGAASDTAEATQQHDHQDDKNQGSK